MFTYIIHPPEHSGVVADPFSSCAATLSLGADTSACVQMEVGCLPTGPLAQKNEERREAREAFLGFGVGGSG